MISYKILIVLTVIFDMTCGSSYLKEREECIDTFRKIKFMPESPLYNVSFFLKFHDQTEYLMHINEILSISISPGDEDVYIPKDFNEPLPERLSYLIEMYSEITQKIDRPKLEKLLPTPLERCTSSIQAHNVTADEDEDISVEITVDEIDEETKKLIENCKISILGFDFVTVGVEFTYDKNRYRNFLTSFELARTIIYSTDQGYVYSYMNEVVKQYFLYHKGLSENNNISEELRMYKISEMCNDYFSEKNKEKIDASKQREKIEKKKKKKEKKEADKINGKDNQSCWPSKK